MYQFVLSRGVSLPFALHSQYPSNTVLLDQTEIKQYHGCVLLVTNDDESDATGDFSVLNQLYDQVVPTSVFKVNFSKLFTYRAWSRAVQLKILSMVSVLLLCLIKPVLIHNMCRGRTEAFYGVN